jgi:proteasome accessory factor C
VVAVPGSDEDGALSRALAKLEHALGEPSVEIELDTPELLDTVRDAVGSGQSLLISYYSASTDQTGERTISPRQLFASEGHWYVDAWCDSVEGVRRFRVDRIASATPAGPAEPTASNDGGTGGRSGSAADSGNTSAPALGAFVPGPDSRRVRIATVPSMSWLFETIPSAIPVDLSADRAVWEVFVAGDAWLERLLLRLGPQAVVVEPTEDRALAPEAATRILALYRSGPT